MKAFYSSTVLICTFAFMAWHPMTVAGQSRSGSGSSSAYGQHSPPSRVGIGGQVGDPSGVTLKVYRRSVRDRGVFGSATAFSFLAAWNLDDFFYLNAHALHERPIEDSPLNYYLGPGVVIGIDERPSRDLVLGISGDFGLNFFTHRFEVFLEITPWIKLIPDTDGSLGGGIGLRYYP